MSSGELASCVHSLYGCCPDGVTARQSASDDDDDDSACSTASTTLLHSTTSHSVASLSQTTVAMTTVDKGTSLPTGSTKSTNHVVSSSSWVTWRNESEVATTTAAVAVSTSPTGREPAYNVTSSRSTDVTTVRTSHWTPDDDMQRRRGVCVCIVFNALCAPALVCMYTCWWNVHSIQSNVHNFSLILSCVKQHDTRNTRLEEHFIL